MTAKSLTYTGSYRQNLSPVATICTQNCTYVFHRKKFKILSNCFRFFQLFQKNENAHFDHMFELIFGNLFDIRRNNFVEKISFFFGLRKWKWWFWWIWNSRFVRIRCQICILLKFKYLPIFNLNSYFSYFYNIILF